MRGDRKRADRHLLCYSKGIYHTAVGGKKQPLTDGEECPLGMVKKSWRSREERTFGAWYGGEVGEMPRR